MTDTLTIYGDFNCPYSCLASLRADRLLQQGQAVEWRAVQHDVAIDPGGEPVTGDLAADLGRELDEIVGLVEAGESVVLRLPRRRPNTAHATRVFAALSGEEADAFRTAAFAAVWGGEGVELEAVAEGRAEDAARASEWQEQWSGLERPVTPTLVLPDGYVSRGLGGLARLADLLRSPS